MVQRERENESCSFPLRASLLNIICKHCSIDFSVPVQLSEEVVYFLSIYERGKCLHPSYAHGQQRKRLISFSYPAFLLCCSCGSEATASGVRMNYYPALDPPHKHLFVFILISAASVSFLH